MCTVYKPQQQTQFTFVPFLEKPDQIKMPAEVIVEELPNMEGDDYPDGMDVFVYCYRNLHV